MARQLALPKPLAQLLPFNPNWRPPMSRWVMNGGPTTCAGCNNPFPYDQARTHIAAKVGRDGKLYCLDTLCEGDAFVAQAEQRRRAS